MLLISLNNYQSNKTKTRNTISMSINHITNFYDTAIYIIGVKTQFRHHKQIKSGNFIRVLHRILLSIG